MIGQLVGAGLGVLQGVAGLFGSGSAKREMRRLEANRPVYTRPDEIKQYLELAKTGAGSQMPGTQQLLENIQQSGQTAVGNIQDTTSSGAASLGAVSDVYGQELTALNNLAARQAEYYEQQQQQLMSALGESAKYSDMEFEYNVNAPWQRKYKNAINKYASNRNLMQSGLGSIANAASFLSPEDESKIAGFFKR